MDNILVIDDENQVRKLTALLIRQKGYQVEEAANGAEALEKLNEHDFHLIVLDYNMPVMNGLSFLQALRADPAVDIPVLMMSGNTEAELRKQCYNLGVFDFITKPESSDILLARVANGLKISQLSRYHREMKREMQISGAIMKRLAIPPEIQGKNFLLQTLNESLVEVGGDICLAFGTDTAKPVFMIGDISGHGLTAALFGIFVNVAIRRAYREALTPHKILSRLNRELTEYLPANYFVTMFCWCYDQRNGTLQYANAGHPPPFIYASGKSSQLEQCKLPALGVHGHLEYEMETTAFSPGDWLMAYTDGVSDLFKDEEYSLDTTISELAGENLNAADLFSKMKSYLAKQTDYIDDRSVMICSAH